MSPSCDYLSIFLDFGDDDIQLTLTHFQDVLSNAGVDTEVAERQWTALKCRLYDEK